MASKSRITASDSAKTLSCIGALILAIRLVLFFKAGGTLGLTHFHRLVLPADANHHGTLYAGSLLRLALEAGYGAAWKHVGTDANFVLRRVLNLECLRPVPVGTVIEIEGVVLHRSQAYLVTGLLGTPLKPGEGPWLEALLGFAQVDETGKLAVLPEWAGPGEVPDSDSWRRINERLHKLLHLR